MYDPSAMRVSAAVPPNSPASPGANAPIQLEIPALASNPALITPTALKLLPSVDAATHSAQMQLALPDKLQGLAPGMFARVWLPAKGAAAGSERLYVLLSAVVRRAEMTGVYVVGAQGRPVLRQVRLGQAQGERVEVLSGLDAADKVAADPQAAAKVR